MTPEQIIEIFIKAAEIDRRLPDTSRPAGLKAQNIGIVHSFEEMAHWPSDELNAIRWAWLDPKKLELTKNDVGLWEVAMELIKLVPDEGKRRALWNWSRSKAGGTTFAKWCRKEGIKVMTGNWRRKSAIDCIANAFVVRSATQHNGKAANANFTTGPQIDDKRSIIKVWRADDARPLACDFDRNLQTFDWAEQMNERRRKRDAKRRKRKAA